MNRKPGIFVAVLAVCLSLSGCATQGQQEQAGMIIGGTLGGLLGGEVGAGSGRTAAIIVGTLGGAAIGGAVGRSMDDTDRLKAAQSLETVRTGVPSAWRNPDTGVEYEFTPTRTFTTATGPCREYTADANIGGERRTVYGTACRQPDGSWRIKE